MDSVVMPQEGLPLDDYKAEHSPLAIEKDDRSPKKPSIRKRTKTGCLTCRKRRIKCDEGKPICNNCIKSKRQCEGYNTRLIFKNPMGAVPGAFGPLPHYPDPTEALVNAQLSCTHSKASSSSQGPLPMIAPKPPSLDFGHAPQFTYMGACPGIPQTNSTAGFGFDGLGPHNSQYVLNAMSPDSIYSRPLHPPPSLHLSLPISSTQMNQSDLFDFHVLDQTPFPRSSTALGLPGRRHTAYAVMERPTISPTTMPYTSNMDLPAPPDSEALEDVDVWDIEEENRATTIFDEGHEAGDLVMEFLSPHANDISSMAIGRLHGSLNFYGTSVRSFQALSDENVLANYTPSPTDSPLNDPKMAAIFWYFLHVTGPALNMYERNRPDPSRIFSGQSVPKSDQHIWTYTFPTQSMKHPALLHAILALGSLQMAEYQHQSPTVSMLHYHICIRRSAKNYQKSDRRTQPATLAAVLLLGFYEVWNTSHEKWCSHMLGAMVIIKETLFREMSRRMWEIHQQRYDKWLELQSHDPFAAFMPQTGRPGYELAEIDLELVSRLSGNTISFMDDLGSQSWESDPRSQTIRDLEDYEQLVDLYWWFCKMDVYQSILGGSRLFLEYDLWTQCPPRAPINRFNQIYGTFDHLVLILGRLSDFVAKDLSRKRRVRQRCTSSSPKGQTSPPMFAGMFPGRGNIRMPRGLDPQCNAFGTADNMLEDADLEECTNRAMDEWESILQAFELFKRSLGPDFDPMGADVHPPQDSPFGPSLTYRTYSIAGIWMNFYMGLVVLHRAHPTMPPFAMVAAHKVAKQTDPYANEIGKIVAGMAEDMTAETTISTMVGAAYIECCFPLFVGAVQFCDKMQRQWAIRRLHDITRLTGWKTSDQIASGCEAAWRKAAEMGVAPEYEPESESVALNHGYTTRRIDSRIQEIDQGHGDSVLQRSDRAHLAIGLLSIDADLEKLSLED